MRGRPGRRAGSLRRRSSPLWHIPDFRDRHDRGRADRAVLSAIFLTEYADPRFRAVVKPLLEILAGVPTVVYGFFAVLTVAPAIRDAGPCSWPRGFAEQRAWLQARSWAIMIIPFISSLSDDAFDAVPRAMRDGSSGLGRHQGRRRSARFCCQRRCQVSSVACFWPEPRHWRDDDRGDGRRSDREAYAEPSGGRHDRDGADRDAAHR